MVFVPKMVIADALFTLPTLCRKMTLISPTNVFNSIYQTL
jgi:hypothetical protein